MDRITANRHNAKKSTRPRHPAGNSNSAKNARKLGIFVCDNTLLQEKPGEIANILAGLISDLEAAGEFEEGWVRAIALASARRDRLARIETGLLNSDERGLTRAEATRIMTRSFLANQSAFDSLVRAQAAAEREFHRAYPVRDRPATSRGPPSRAQSRALRLQFRRTNPN